MTRTHQIELANMRRYRALTLRQRLRLRHRLNHANGLDAVIAVIGHEMRRNRVGDGYLVNLIDETNENLVCRGLELPPGFEDFRHSFLNYKFPLRSDDPNVESFSKHTAVQIRKEDIVDYLSASNVRFDRWKLESLLVVPICLNDSCQKPLGTMMVLNQQGEFSPMQVQFITAMLRLAYRRLQDAKTLYELKQKEQMIGAVMKEEEDFFEFVNKVNNLGSVKSIYQYFSDELFRRFSMDFVSISISEGDFLANKEIFVQRPEYIPVADELKVLYAEHPVSNKRRDTMVNESFCQNTQLYVEDCMKIAHLPMKPEAKRTFEIMKTPRTVFHTPIRRQLQPIGVLTLISVRDIFHVTEYERRLIQLICDFLGTVASNVQLYMTVESQKKEIEKLNSELADKVDVLGQLVAKDYLTGLGNFGRFEEELNRRLNEYKRDPQCPPLSVVIFDIDHFKQFNDSYGHLAGNAVLKEVANQILQRARQMDVACRYGGEEFAVILPKCRLQDAFAFAEQIRASIERTQLDTEWGTLRITVSAGCASFSYKEESVDLVKRADDALYRAKKAGRNRVTFAN